MAQANQRISEYLLDARIGGGTFGEVWRAHHHVWVDQVVAIKIPSDPQYLRNLQREGLTVHGLLHPNIVRAIGFDPYADPPYLVMEFVPGTSLRPLIQNRSMSVPDSIAVLRQMLRGLAYAHAAGLVHRDIKPENILIHERAIRDGLAAEGVVKITDFGLGRATAGGGGGAESIAFSASMNSPAGRDIAGTLDYMSPEQRAGTAPDARGDLYSCGVVLYEMLTGERPAGTELPSERNPQVPAVVDTLFKRSYARLERRYKSAEEFLADLPPTAALMPAPPRSGPAVSIAPAPMTATAMHVPSGAAPPPMPGAGVIAAGAAAAGHAARQVCPRCRQLFDVGDQFCMHCGTQLVPVVRRCPRCGAYPDGTDRYCIFCGETLALAQPVSA